ncbi:5'-nucleotidase, lipoprotein e(P4) family [Paraglaciecola sp. 2405UD69-4]|uniref:5'-nucleotidase, lipoprotein e(P4) family n=1 Tax=Paraglaciecola sp. 2405UD69-4 TaxID=3391836 RepID=UPI0039C8DA32
MNKLISALTCYLGASLLVGCSTTTHTDTATLSLSNSVKWQTQSKEYQLITRGVYQKAEQQLVNVASESGPWVVVMDVDETVLDNSAYQVMLDTTGGQYSSETWASWIESKQATLVPGAADFMKKVYAMGGKVALVTNREKKQDAATWENLSKFIPVTFENTCLMGRTQADKDAINETSIVNDKDLRRQQITSGEVDCFSEQGEQTSWHSGHTIVMQIGDNIEDVNGVTQENANVDALETRLYKDIFILPNAMYGSW